jgi:hypothetical protein
MGLFELWPCGLAAIAVLGEGNSWGCCVTAGVLRNNASMLTGAQHVLRGLVACGHFSEQRAGLAFSADARSVLMLSLEVLVGR